MFSASGSSADTTLADTRESYAYWRARRSKLGWHRRAARREARTMAARWRARLVRTHFERLGLGAVPAVVEPLVSIAGRSRREHARWLWHVVGRTPLANRRLWVTLMVTAATVAALGVVAVHAIWVLLF